MQREANNEIVCRGIGLGFAELSAEGAQVGASSIWVL